MQTITLGVLLPTSGIRPMSKQFDRSLRKALEEGLKDTDYEVEVLAEMIGAGSSELVNTALDKFFGYHEVDIAAGIVTRYGIQLSLDRFEKKKVPFVFCNLGEHLIPAEGYHNYAFINSVHLWQQAWLLGEYAARHVGSRGATFCSMYDSGYSFLSAFQQSTLRADPDHDLQLKLMPMPEAGKLSAIKESFDTINWEEVDYVFTLLCGEEATQFLEEFKARGLAGKVAIIGLPYLVELGEADLSGLSIISSHHQPEASGEDLLYANVFENLGSSFGKALSAAIVKGKGKVERDLLNEAMISEDDTKIYDSTKYPQSTAPIGLFRHSIGAGNGLTSELLMEQKVELYDDEEFNESRDAISANWMNPYLAI